MLALELAAKVAICTGRVEAKQQRLFVRDAVIVAICTERVEAKNTSAPSMLVTPPGCNLHGACGGKGYENSTFGDR